MGYKKPQRIIYVLRTSSNMVVNTLRLVVLITSLLLFIYKPKERQEIL